MFSCQIAFLSGLFLIPSTLPFVALGAASQGPSAPLPPGLLILPPVPSVANRSLEPDFCRDRGSLWTLILLGVGEGQGGPTTLTQVPMLLRAALGLES